MGLTEFLATYITKFIESTGYVTVFVGMVFESMILPIPSEAVMPFAGFLIAEGKFSFFWVIFISTFGSLIGSLISYYMGLYGGGPFVKKFGKYFPLDQSELDFTKKFFQKYGEITIFIGRFIPIIRHLISVPAGIAKMNLWKFSLLTILGAGLWNSILTVLGYYLRQNWQLLMSYSKIVDIFVIIVLMALIFLYFFKHAKNKRTNHVESE